MMSTKMGTTSERWIARWLRRLASQILSLMIAGAIAFSIPYAAAKLSGLTPGKPAAMSLMLLLTQTLLTFTLAVLLRRRWRTARRGSQEVVTRNDAGVSKNSVSCLEVEQPVYPNTGMSVGIDKPKNRPERRALRALSEPLSRFISKKVRASKVD